MSNGYEAFLEKMKGILIDHQIPNFENVLNSLHAISTVSHTLDKVFFILDYRIQQFLYISPNCEEVEGYTQEELYEIGPIGIMELMHPNDANTIMNKLYPEGNKTAQKLPKSIIKNFKVSFNYRLLQKDNSYLQLQQEFSTLLFDKDKNPLVIIGTLYNTDTPITPFVITCKVAYKTFLNNWITLYKKKYAEADINNQLSPKELEIISYASKGYSSKQIADFTNKSIETVKTQRKIILQKTNTKNISEVVTLAINNNWI